MSFNFNDPNPRNLDLGQSFGSNPLPKPPGFNNTGDGFSHVVNDNGAFGSNGGIQSMDRNTFNNWFGNPQGNPNASYYQNTPYDRQVQDALGELQNPPQGSTGPIARDAATLQAMQMLGQQGVQSPFNYPGYTNPNANQQPASPQYPTQAGGGFDQNLQRPGWWNQGEAGPPGSPDFVRNPKTDQDWQQRYYWLQNNEQQAQKGMANSSFSQYLPWNAEWMRPRTPEQQHERYGEMQDYINNVPGAVEAFAPRNPDGSLVSRDAVARQLRSWQMEDQGGKLEPGSAASPYGRYHLPNGQIIDVGTGQVVNLPPPPRPTYGGYSAPRATYTATPKATTAAPNFGTAAVNALLKPPAAPAPYMASSPPEILGYGAQAPVALPDSNLLRRLMQYGTYGLKLGVK